MNTTSTDELIKSCLEFLRKNRLLEIKKEKNSKGLHEIYFATERLKSIYPKIAKVMMPSIKSVLDAERQIRIEILLGFSNIWKK